MKRLMIWLRPGVLLVWFFSGLATADVKPLQDPEKIIQTQPAALEKPISGSVIPAQPASPQAYQLNWMSINGGGAINATSPSYQLGLSVGQSVAGAASSPSYKMGIGFWYGAAGAPACAAARGDLNGSGGFSAWDVVLMLNCVFTCNGAATVGGDCNLCYSDMNCSGGLSASDVVLELNYVFLGSPPPC